MNRLLPLVLAAFSATPVAAQDRPLPPKEAPKRMTVPEGFRVTLFAGEPDVVQPVAFSFDDRGRLWVVECLSYPEWTDGAAGKDRVVLFEDTDGDGTFDRRTVVFDRGANLSGIELGFGGVWLCSSPNLLFVPCDFNADRPTFGKPEAVLDGWSLKAKHNVFNGLIWGPDGWLYGCNGILDTSHVGKPGTPPGERVPMNCGVWRYHPTRKHFEVFASGTTNPWGLDFDDSGEAFITNCVIHHLWHVVYGAHFQRMYGQDLNANVQALLPSVADHLHWGGGDWTTSRGGKGVHDAPGGGHAHSGCMVYLGDNFPSEYRDNVFMCNIHGNRVNRDILERRGSTYVAHHGRDFLLANDPWFRGLAVKYGADGGVYVADWTDTGECHNYQTVDRTNGRVFKVTYGKPEPFRGDVSKLADAELARLQSHKNEWLVRHARRVLQERAAAGRGGRDVTETLLKSLRSAPEEAQRLRALWALHAVNHFRPADYLSLLSDPNVRVASWALRLFFEEYRTDAELHACATIEHPHRNDPVYRLAVAAGLQRVAAWDDDLMRLLAPAGARDANDLYLPLMTWYAVEPKIDRSPERAVEFIDKTEFLPVCEFVARRLALLPASGADQRTGLQQLVDWLGRSGDPERQAAVLRGVLVAFAGQRDVKAPEHWSELFPRLAASPAGQVRDPAMKLAVLFGDAKAIDALRQTALSPKADRSARESALQALLSRRQPDLLPALKVLLADTELRAAAIRGLAAFNDPATPELLLKHYADLTAEEKADVIQTLASRPPYAAALLDAIEQKRVPRTDVSAFTARQILNLKDKALGERLTHVWGQIRPASEQRGALTAKYRALLTDTRLKAADLSRGRQVFAGNCASCHRLYGVGGDIGPALTGSQRANLDYVLENVLDPNAVVAKDYQVTVIRTDSGRTLNGIIKQETDRTVSVQTQNELVVVPKNEIEERRQSNVSMMPEGLLDRLTEQQVIDLVAYLRTTQQVPLPGETKP